MRDTIQQLQDELVEIGQEFGRNTRIATDYPDYVPFTTYAVGGAAREQFNRVA